MKYIKTLVTALAVVTLFTTTTLAADTNTVTATDSSQWNLTLAGSGATTTENDNTSAVGLDIGLGKTGHLILPVEAGIRQNITFQDANQSSLDFSTKAYIDWTLISLGSLDLAVGGNIGAEYGDVSLAWSAAPEVVGRLWLKKDVYAFTRVEYTYDIENSTWDKTFQYTIGVGIRF